MICLRKLHPLKVECLLLCQNTKLIKTFSYVCTNRRFLRGRRPLIDPSKVFEHNNWDNVEWDDEQEAEAKKKVQKNSETLIDETESAQYETQSDKYWDAFYMQHQNRFFKDRNWLFTEFPELLCGMAEKYKHLFSEDNTEDEHSIQSHSKHSSTIEENSVVNSPSLSNESIVENHHSVKEIEERTKELVVKESVGSKVTACTSSNSREVVKSGEELCNSGDKKIINDVNIEDYPGMRAKHRIFEVGCGVGNTVFPVLQTINDPELFVYCCDLSSTAIDLVKQHKDYTAERCHAFVGDVTDPDMSFPFPENSLDVITLIFVMSAIHPERMQTTINRLAAALKPGGIILFRDYGRYDLAQLRFKTGRCLSENFYVRGDGTRVYFFTQEELKELFTNAGLTEKQNDIDRRLQVNRGKMLKMYRVWIQCKYTKPLS